MKTSTRVVHGTFVVALSAALAFACGPGEPNANWPVGPAIQSPPTASTPSPLALATASSPTSSASATATIPVAPACGNGAKLRVRFYDVGQGLAALVDLPDGRHILVDAGDAPSRPKCDDVCKKGHDHLMTSLARDLGTSPIDMLWITHPHSDHMGGASDIIEKMTVRLMVDNGLDTEKAEMKALHSAASKRNVNYSSFIAGANVIALADGGDAHFRGISPAVYSAHCKEDPNACSIVLRIDYCASSVLFVGDAEKTEEKSLEFGGPVTLLQVGHHGSNTSSTPAFLQRALPRYAVISSGKPDEGLNKGYCHPRASTVEAISRVLSPEGRPKTLRSYGESKCVSPSATGWADTPASDRLFSTARDGDVVLVTTGDGTFARE